jgi:hypothetical protein
VPVLWEGLACTTKRLDDLESPCRLGAPVPLACFGATALRIDSAGIGRRLFVTDSPARAGTPSRFTDARCRTLTGFGLRASLVSL